MQVVLQSEVDGVRVIGPLRQELVRKVPAAIAEVRGRGAMSGEEGG